MPSVARQEYEFVNQPVLLRQWNRCLLFPCIVLCHAATKATVAYPCFERWYLRLNEAEEMAPSTLRKRAAAVCQFLNHVLWRTNCSIYYEQCIADGQIPYQRSQFYKHFESIQQTLFAEHPNEFPGDVMQSGWLPLKTALICPSTGEVVPAWLSPICNRRKQQSIYAGTEKGLSSGRRKSGRQLRR